MCFCLEKGAEPLSELYVCLYNGLNVLQRVGMTVHLHFTVLNATVGRVDGLQTEIHYNKVKIT